MGQHYNVRDLVCLTSSFGECCLSQIRKFSNQKETMKYAKVIQLAKSIFFVLLTNLPRVCQFAKKTSANSWRGPG